MLKNKTETHRPYHAVIKHTLIQLPPIPHILLLLRRVLSRDIFVYLSSCWRYSLFLEDEAVLFNVSRQKQCAQSNSRGSGYWRVDKFFSPAQKASASSFFKTYCQKVRETFSCDWRSESDAAQIWRLVFFCDNFRHDRRFLLFVYFSAIPLMCVVFIAACR